MNWIVLVQTFTVCLFVSTTLSAQDVPKSKGSAKEPKAPTPAAKEIPGLPRVLLIGDSISIGYTAPVQKLLEGKANVLRIPGNGGPTKNGLSKIDAWLGTNQWDVIHFNFGIHDAKFMTETSRQVEPADYEANLRALVKRMKSTRATLIWATTTPIPDGELNPPRRFEKVSVYNTIANKVMKENGVIINDLNAWITPKLSEMQRPKDVHYSAEGSAYLAQQVASTIEQHLKRP